MSANYFWQDGEKVYFEEAGNEITIHADNEQTARDLGYRSGVELESVEQVAPTLVRARVPKDRDRGMARLREEGVVHHVYRPPGETDAEYLITDTFFIKFQTDTPARTIQQYLREESLEVVDDMGDGTLLVRVTDATGRNPIKTANSAAQRDDVEYAEPNLVRTLQKFLFIPADPLFPRQWHLHAPDDGEELVHGADISAPEAWETTRGVRSVVISVADDGCDVTHPDFIGPGKIAGKLNAMASGQSVVFDDQVMPQAGDYHGTPCTGVAVAEQNGQGTVGVAPGCALLAVRFPLSFTDAQMV